MKRSSTPHCSAPARGAATLVVVMVLFFMVAMVAAYSNRTLIFDQRTSTNQLRATQAFATAEAGVDWAISQLNAGLVDNSCRASTTADNDAHRALRDRHLSVTASDASTGLADGTVTPRLNSDFTQLVTRCVLNAADPDAAVWNCVCDQADVAQTPPARPSGSQPAPAFSVLFAQETTPTSGDPLPPTVTRLVVTGCSQHSGCFDLVAGADSGSSVATINTMVVIRPALRTQPAAPLTIGGTVGAVAAGGFAGGQSIRLVNDPMVATNAGLTPPSAGFTVVAGGSAPDTNMLLQGTPGTPSARTRVEGDASLALPAISAADFPPSGLTSADRFFVGTFGMAPAVYGSQPAIVRMTCAAGAPCTAADVRTQIERNPGHAIWLTGPGGLTLDGNLGVQNDSATQPVARGPVLLIVDGGPVVASNNAVVWGVIYGRGADFSWTVSGPVTINGAILAEGNFSLAAGATAPQLTVDYSEAHRRGVFNFLRTRAGSYSRLHDGWRDWYN